MLFENLSGPLRVSIRLSDSQNNIESQYIQDICNSMKLMRVNIITMQIYDPNAYPLIFEFIKLLDCKIHKILSVQNTNFTENLLDRLRESGLDTMALVLRITSLEDIQNKLQELKNSVKLCVDGGIKTSIVVPLNSGVLTELDSILAILKDINVEKLSFSPPEINTDGISSETVLDAYTLINAFNMGKPVIIQDPLASKITGQDYGPTFFPSCPAGRSMLHIETDGTVYPCTRLKVSCGNIKERALHDIWKDSEGLKQIRSLRNGETCSKCEHISNCLGGCKARLYKLNQDMKLPDPLCWHVHKGV
ncbi:MAG TPA: radical SAM/SPASM domain-containing protein [Clostridia bacterium]|nr:radical SAM/SPASM domain-containing protein [Clostridia bacterium]